MGEALGFLGGDLRFLLVSCDCLGILREAWVELGFLGVPWGSLGRLGVPWGSLGLLGFLWKAWGSLGGGFGFLWGRIEDTLGSLWLLGNP